MMIMICAALIAVLIWILHESRRQEAFETRVERVENSHPYVRHTGNEGSARH